MEQQFNTPSQQMKEITPTPEVKFKTPLFVKIIAWLMLLRGIGGLFMALPFLLLNRILGGLYLLIAVGLIATSFGLQRMKKWSLYVFTAMTVLLVGLSIYSFFTSSVKNMADFADAGIQVLVLIYFWVISKKFV